MPTCIRFLLNGEKVELTGPQPTRTVLEYLRIDCGLTGTKEGCAEGDCGACTVVIAEASVEGKLNCHAVNACIQFLPTLDGKALYTVESLETKSAGKDATIVLHPVQEAMVEQHASQCGFCTPGFVMSLFALYKTNSSPTRAQIEDALSGNLCRCTGYRPIIDAASRMNALGHALSGETLDWIDAPAARSQAASTSEANLVKQLCALRNGAPHDALPQSPSKTFHAPRSIEELATLRAAKPAARLLAGGTDMGLWITKQLKQIPEVIYLGEVDALQRIAHSPSHLEIGAGVTISQAMPFLTQQYPGITEVLRRFASPPIRNAATLGGNIANGSPIGDSMPCLIALGASIGLRSVRGARNMALEDFFIAYQKTALEADEFVETIRIPHLVPQQRFRAYKISKRYDQDISIVLAAINVTIEANRLSDCRIAFGGMAATPKRAKACEAALRGKVWHLDTIEAAIAKLPDDFSPLSDLRGSAAYRLRVAGNLLKRFFAEESARPDATVSLRLETLETAAP
ncbi:MAG: xanthine dehydrogenase small subunit [Burkholderiales bacterium]